MRSGSASWARVAYVSKGSPLHKELEGKTLLHSFTVNGEMHLTFTDGSRTTIKKGDNL